MPWTALVSRGEYRTCIALGEQRLAAPDLAQPERASLMAALCRSHLHLGAPRQAIKAGEAALAEAEPDTRGAVLHDLAHALAHIGDWAGVTYACATFESEVRTYSAARCLEGRILLQLAEGERGMGRLEVATVRLSQAQAWFERFGDRSGQLRALHGQIAMALAEGDAPTARRLIEEGEGPVQVCPDSAAVSLHLLDRAAYYRSVECWEGAAKLAWVALERADEDWEMAARAHLLLGEVALAVGEAVDALNFAVGARAAAATLGDEVLQSAAHQLQATVWERYGEGPNRELAADYERLVTEGALRWVDPVTGDD